MAKWGKAENKVSWGQETMCSADTSKTGQEEAQRRSSDVGPDPKIRWSAACSSSFCRREFCIQPGFGKWNFFESSSTWTNLAFLPQMMHSPFVSCVSINVNCTISIDGIRSCLEALLLPIRCIIQKDWDESKQKDSWRMMSIIKSDNQKLLDKEKRDRWVFRPNAAPSEMTGAWATRKKEEKV